MGKKDLTRCFCDIPEEKLCRLIPSGNTVGKITADFAALTGVPAGLPLISTGSDKGCETLGLSVLTPDKASISFGTTATIQLAVKKYFEPQKFLPAYPAVINDMYNPEIEIYRGFWMLSWFVREFAAAEVMEAQARGCAPEQLLDQAIEDIPPGSDGLLLQPYWTPGILKPDSMKRKQFEKGIEQIAQEGAIQIFHEPGTVMEEIVVGVVGVLQLEVLEYRLKTEYGVDIRRRDLPYSEIRWLADQTVDPRSLNLTSDTKWVQDFKGSNLLLFTADWCVRWAEQKNKGLELREFNQD